MVTLIDFGNRMYLLGKESVSTYLSKQRFPDTPALIGIGVNSVKPGTW